MGGQHEKVEQWQQVQYLVRCQQCGWAEQCQLVEQHKWPHQHE